MGNRSSSLAGTRIGVVGKGGSGKSTVTVFVASALRRHGYEICVLDADSTNVGLHRALGIDTPPAPLLDYFGGMIFSGGAVTCPVDDPTPLAHADIDLEKLPGEYHTRSEDGVTLLTVGKIADKGPGAGCDGPISKIARDLRIRVGDALPVTVVDFKAGFEDSARGVLNGVDWALVTVDPTNAAIQMAVDMKEMVRQTRAGRPPATQHLDTPVLVEMAIRMFREARVRDVLVVLNRVRDRKVETYLTDRLEEAGIQPIAVIPEDPAITISWLEGVPLARRFQETADRVVSALEDAARRPSAVG
ncbi:MAG: P-loop NTPase [Gemmatimonadota bacterium]|nr:MAG: P-loop NTPase [Gemmatimonadota bacterium]